METPAPSARAIAGARLLVTGAAGFIGSHLVERLLALGAEVVGVDNFVDFYDPRAKRANLGVALAHPSFRLVEGDIRDRGLLDRAIAGCEAAVHLAAMPGVRYSLVHPEICQDVNVGGTVSVLEACRRNGVHRLVFASSSSVYGNNPKVPFAETDPVDHPISVYAATKRAGELLCHTYHATGGLGVTCLRLFTVYGPRQRPDLAIHKFALLMERGAPVPVFGDGSMARDFTYVDDAIAGLVAAITTCVAGEHRMFNLGSDRPIRLDALIPALERALGKRATIERLPAPPGEVTRTWADLSRAAAVLGYRPDTPLAAGLAAFVSWLRAPRAA